MSHKKQKDKQKYKETSRSASSIDKADNSQTTANTTQCKSRKKYVNFYGQDHKPGLIKGW